MGAMWIALVRGWRRDCVVGGMETRFQCRKAHSRTAKCEAFHVAPRLFFMFLFFLIPFTIRQQCRIYPQKFSTNFLLSAKKRRPWVVAFLDWNWYVSVITLVRIRTLVGHQDRHRLEVDRLDDHRGRLEEVRLGLGRRHGHPIGSFGWADCPLRMW